MIINSYNGFNVVLRNPDQQIQNGRGYMPSGYWYISNQDLEPFVGKTWAEVWDEDDFQSIKNEFGLVVSENNTIKISSDFDIDLCYSSNQQFRPINVNSKIEHNGDYFAFFGAQAWS